MGRIEDETVRYLFFLRFETGAPPELPFRNDDEEYEEDEDEDVSANGAVHNGVQAEQERQQLAAKAAAQISAQDLTKNIQRKKERELAELSFVGGDTAATATKTVVKGKKVGRNEPCPCGSGKKYKNCHGTAA